MSARRGRSGSQRHGRRGGGLSTRVLSERGLSRIRLDPLLAQRWAVKYPSQLPYLRQMFSKAVKAGLIELNVWRFVEVDRRSAPRLPPSTEELDRMVAASRARGGWWVVFADCIVFTAYSGLRGGEVQGVQAQDVLDGGRRLVVRGKRRPGEAAPRVRTVAVFGPGREALARNLPEVGRVWRASKGGWLSQDVRDRCYGSLTRECGVVGTFHGLRHYMTTWLLDQGASKQDVAIQLGHIDAAGRVETTQVERVYGHPTVGPALDRLEAVANEGVPHAGRDGAGADARAEDGGVGQGEQDPELPGAVEA